MTTQEYVDGQWTTIRDTFAVYGSWEDSVKAHTQLFVNGTDWNTDHYGPVLQALACSSFEIVACGVSPIAKYLSAMPVRKVTASSTILYVYVVI